MYGKWPYTEEPVYIFASVILLLSENKLKKKKTNRTKKTLGRYFFTTFRFFESYPPKLLRSCLSSLSSFFSTSFPKGRGANRDLLVYDNSQRPSHTLWIRFFVFLISYLAAV